MDKEEPTPPLKPHPRNRPLTPKQIEKQARINRSASCLYWVKNDAIIFPPNKLVDLRKYSYQIELFGMYPGPKSKEFVGKKAAQIGWTVFVMITNIHGLKYGYYPNGVLHLFPTDGVAQYVSKTKLLPMITNNPGPIASCVGQINDVGARQFGDGYYYLRGARESQKVDGQASSSIALKTISVDKNVYDEIDEMDPDKVELAKYRFADSDVQEEVYLSTPTLPDFGIDAKYEASDQSVWMIKCSKCGKHTALEQEFPNCIIEDLKGNVFRICKHCRAPLSEDDIACGEFVSMYPSRTKDSHGVWLSSLSIPKRDPKLIWKKIQNPDPIVQKNVFNSDLAMPFLQTQDALTKQDVYACCGSFPMATSSPNIQCAAGIDVKSDDLHVTIGYRKTSKTYRILWLGRVKTFEEANDICKRLNVRCIAVDYEPETRAARAFRDAYPYPVYLVDYQDRLKSSSKVDEKDGTLTVRRTETMDKVLYTVKERMIEFPRKTPEVTDHYAVEMSKTAKILVEDKVTGSRRYVWKKLGPEHYFHSTNYFILACANTKVHSDTPEGFKSQDYVEDERNNNYDPFEG